MLIKCKCQSCGKMFPFTPPEQAVHYSREQQRQVYVVTCPHCGARNRVEVHQ